jgi:hypothetical protein
MERVKALLSPESSLRLGPVWHQCQTAGFTRHPGAAN